jgi:hypothetical protein
VTKSPVKLSDLFRYYKQLPHQMAAIIELEAALLKVAPDAFNRDQPWFKTWSQEGKQSTPRFTPASPFAALVAPHITYGEVCINEERRRFTNQAQCDICTELCLFIEKARTQFGNKPIIITSGHRPKNVNQAIGGASNSEHLYKPGCGAIDWYIQGVPVKAVQDWCDAEWPFSLGYGADRGFVHLGLRAGRPRVRWVY